MDTISTTHLGAVEIARSIAAGDVSAREVVDTHIARIEATHDRLNAVVIQRFRGARVEADDADTRQRRGEPLGPLHGVPVTIKDQFDVAGLPTTIGTPRLAQRLAERDGAMVGAWRQAGAIVLGKGNVPQALSASETDNDLFGRTNNPWDASRTPGGSSGADAAIVAAGGVPLALGGDWGGSLRVPAAWCGIATVNATARRFPIDSFPDVRSAFGTEGIIALPGPLARRTEDVAAALRVMIDAVLNRPTGSSPPVPWRDPAEVDVGRLRVGVLQEVAGWTPAPAIRRALAEAATSLRAAGADVEVWNDGPDTLAGVLLGLAIGMGAGASPMRQALRGDAPHALVKADMQMMALPRPALRAIASLLARTGQERAARLVRSVGNRSAAELYDLMGDRAAYETAFLVALEAAAYDVLLCPPMPIPAPRHRQTPDLIDAFAAPALFTTLGMPTGVVAVTRVRPGEESDRPVSKDKAFETAREAERGSAGLPVGVMVAGRHWREDVVLAVMAAIEETTLAEDRSVSESAVAAGG